MKLLETIESKNSYKAAYEWRKSAILLCEFIVPFTKFYDVKMGTITIIMRMLDPDRICGIDAEQTKLLRQRCTHASIFLGNVAGKLLCTWDTTKIDEEEWVPSTWGGDDATLPSFVPFRDAPWMPETPDDLCQVSYDKEGHVICKDHDVSQPAQDCPWCQHR